MAVMSQADRDRVSRWFQRDSNLGNCSFTKPQLAAAVASADQWADDNATEYNNALPAAFRNAADGDQKTLLLAYVILRRRGLLGIGGND